MARIASTFNTPAYVTKDGSRVCELVHPDKDAARNLSLAEARVAPGSSTEPHIHETSEEIYHFTAGSGEMELGGERFAVAAGDTVFIAPGTPHRLFNGSGEELVLLCACSPAYCHGDTRLLEE